MKKYTYTEKKDTRSGFGAGLLELGKNNPNIVAMCADLTGSLKMDAFAKDFPDRFFQVGIAEANMIGTGAGLALSGYIQFICSFGAFVTGRYDQIRMSVAYAGAPVRIVGTHAGVGIGDDGHSQMGLEDAGMMRALPTMMVLQPADEIETRLMMEFLVSDAEALKHPAYLRLTRQNLVPVHGADYKFRLGKLDILKTGSKVVVLATGGTVGEALSAVETLAASGVQVTLVNVPSLKPFDDAGVIELAKKHQAIVTVEDHVVVGALGSAVAEAVAGAGISTKVVRLGIQDQFGESGEAFELYEKFEINAVHIAAAVKKLLG